MITEYHDPSAPWNREEEERFSSLNLNECLEYAKETGEFEELEEAIYNLDGLIAYCVGAMKNTENALVTNKLKQIQKLLK